MSRRLFCLCALALPLFILGCGGRTFSISGKVNYKGQPVDDGAIAFDAPDGKTPSIGGRIDKGTYSIPDVPAEFAGKKVVRIYASRKTGRKIPAGPPTPPGTMTDELDKVPPQFNEQSTLSAEVGPGQANVCDFELPPR